jgi:hypothetical protein
VKTTALLLSFFLLSGCSAVAALMGDGAVLPSEPTTARASYRLVASGPPGQAQVLLFSVSGRLGGLEVTDYAGLGSELYILPGSYTIAYACPGAAVHSYDNTARVRISRNHHQYFYCRADGTLAVGRSSRHP